MSAFINLIEFDDYSGEIDLPGWESLPFTQPGTQYTGVHLNPPVSMPSELTLTQFGPAAQMATIWANQKSLESTEQSITLGDVNYFTAYNLVFHILDVKPVLQEVIPHASGYRSSGNYDFTPACRVITKWTVLPLPT